MAAKSPYIMRDGTSHILSEAAKRFSKPVKVWEMRISMNGWRAQHLVHNCDRFAEVTLPDLEAYAKERKIKPTSNAVSSVLASIVGSVPLGFNVTPGGRSSVTTREQGFGQHVTAQHLDNLARAYEEINANASTFRVKVWHSDSPTLQSVVSGVWSRWDTAVNAQPLIDALKKGNPSFDYDTSRFIDPVGCFKDMISAHLGIPVPMIHFVGSCDPGETDRSVPRYESFATGSPVKSGFTLILAPLDLRAQTGCFLVPKIPGVKVAVIGRRVGSREYNRAPVLYFGKTAINAADVNASNVIAAPNNTFALVTMYENSMPYKRMHIIPDAAPASGTITPALAGLDVSLYEALGSPKLLSKNDRGEWGAFVSGTDLSYVRLEGLFYAKPNGFKEIIIDSPAVNTVQSESEYGGVIGVSPVKVNASLSMSAIRAYMRAKLAEPGIDAKDKQVINAGLTKSESYADGLLYCTAYHNGWEFPSTSDLSQLTITRIARDADQDLMNEDLGEGVTFTKAGAKFDKLRAAGGRAFAAVSMVDDQVAPDDMVSPLISGRFRPWMWEVRPVYTDGAIVGWRGLYDGGGEEALTVDDAFALVGGGSRVTLPAGLTLEAVYSELVIDPAHMSQYGSILSVMKSRVSGAAYDGMHGVGDMAMSPADFRDALGYPVLNYLQADSRYRALLVLKGLGEDMEGMFLTLFFLNQLDVKS